MKRIQRSKPAPRNRQKPELRGRKFKPPTQPPEITPQPFNALTIFHVGKGDTGTYDFTAKDIANMIIAQVNPSKLFILPATALEVRVQKIRVWNISGKTLHLVAYDYLSSATTQASLQIVIDMGSPSTYPAVGYEWPTTHQQTVLNSTITKNIFSIVAGAKADVVMYISVLWRIYGMPVPQYTLGLLARISGTLEDVKKDTKDVADQAKESNSHLKEIRESQPGLVSKIINGVAHIGAYVAPLAADEVTLSALKDIQESVQKLSLMHSCESLEYIE